MSRLLWAAAPISLALAATEASAQSSDRRLAFTLGAKVFSDTNVTRSSPEVAARRGLQLDDVVFTPSLTIDAAFPVSRHQFYVRALGGYDFYENNDRLDKERIDVEGGVVLRQGPCAGTVAGIYARNQTQLEDLLLNEVENLEERDGGRLSVGCERSGLAPTLAISREQSRNSTMLRRAADKNIDTVNGALFYRRGRGEMGVTVGHVDVGFPHRVSALASAGYELDTVALSYRRQTGRLTGDVEISYLMLEPDSDDLPDFRGPGYRVGLNYLPNRKVRIRVEGRYAIEPSNRTGASYSVSQEARVAAEYEVGVRTMLSLGAGRTTSELKVAEIDPTLPLARKDEVDELFFSVRYRPRDRLAITVDTRRQERRADLPEFNYVSDRIGLTFISTF